MNLNHLKLILKQKFWVMVCIPALTGFMVYVYTLREEEYYKSTAELLVIPANLTEAQPVTGENISDHVEAMKTELICAMVSYRLLLHDLNEQTPFRDLGVLHWPYSNSDSIEAKLKSHLTSFNLFTSRDPATSEIIYALEKKKYNPAKWITNGNLRIERIKDSDIIRIEFFSENPFLSAFVVNTICQEYIRYADYTYSSGAGDSVQVLEALLSEKKEAITAAQIKKEEYKAPPSPVYTTTNTRNQSELLKLKQELHKTEATSNELKLLVRNLKLKLAQSENRTVHNLDNKKLKLSELESKINELQKIYTDNGSTNQELASTLSSLRDQFHMAEQALDNELKEALRNDAEFNELSIKKARAEDDLRKANDKLLFIQSALAKAMTAESGDSKAIASSDTTMADLENAYQLARQEYEHVLEKVKKAKSHSRDKNNRIELVLRGQPGAEPEPPERLVVVSVSILFSGALGIVVILLTSRARPKHKPAYHQKLTVVR